jgi:hypothetical protein
MKIRYIMIAIILFSQSVIAQDTLYQSQKKALIYAFDGSHLGYFGGKYWLTNRLAAQITFFFDIYSYNEHHADFAVENKDEEYRPGIGIQYIITSIEDVAVLGTADFAVGFGKFRSSGSYIDGSTYSNKDTFTNYYVTVGIGIELWLTKKITLTGTQTVTIQNVSKKYSSVYDWMIAHTDTGTNYYADNAKLTLSLYF